MVCISVDDEEAPPSSCFPNLHCIFCFNTPSISSAKVDTLSCPGISSNRLKNDTRPPEVLALTPRTEKEVLSSSGLIRFSFRDLKIATQNFQPDNLLGEGGFGYVFKGYVGQHCIKPGKPDYGHIVAVKILTPDSLQGHKEWLAEVDFLSEVHHQHLVKLVGYCIEGEQRLLVYEFMEKGNLENHLFYSGDAPLTWHIRMKIAWGAAMGLAFLHGWRRPIIFRDFKASNILLDAEFNAKLSDFGLARDGPQGDKSHVSTRVMGTYGYAAPEYVMTGHLTTRSDVYSFGVVLLEIITGRQSMDKTRPHGQDNLVEWALPLLRKQKVVRLVDPRLNGNYSVKGAKQAASLALRCLSTNPKARPAMQEIVKILYPLQIPEGEAPVSRAPAKR